MSSSTDPDPTEIILSLLDDNKQSMSDQAYKVTIEFLSKLKRSQQRFNVKLTYVRFEANVDSRMISDEGNDAPIAVMIKPRYCIETYENLILDEAVVSEWESGPDDEFTLDWLEVIEFILLPNGIKKYGDECAMKVLNSRHCRVKLLEDDVLVSIEKVF